MTATGETLARRERYQSRMTSETVGVWKPKHRRRALDKQSSRAAI